MKIELTDYGEPRKHAHHEKGISVHSEDASYNTISNTDVDVTENNVDAKCLGSALLSMPTTLTVRAAHVDDDL